MGHKSGSDTIPGLGDYPLNLRIPRLDRVPSAILDDELEKVQQQLDLQNTRERMTVRPVPPKREQADARKRVLRLVHKWERAFDEAKTEREVYEAVVNLASARDMLKQLNARTAARVAARCGVKGRAE